MDETSIPSSDLVEPRHRQVFECKSMVNLFTCCRKDATSIKGSVTAGVGVSPPHHVWQAPPLP